MGFLGQYEHTLDAKNRLTIPSRFRAALSDGVILARLFEPCVTIHTPDGWERYAGTWIRTRDPLNQRARDLQRYISAGAFDARLDAAGRIMLPPHLVEHASLRKEVVVIGCDDFLEVWDREQWRRFERDSDGTVGEWAQQLAADSPVKP